MVIIENNNLPYRFLYANNTVHKRLFWFHLKNDDLYFTTSSKQIYSSGETGIKPLIINNDNFIIDLNKSVPQFLYNNFKFSFHLSGIRHIKMTNAVTKQIETIYREKYLSFYDMKKPEMLITLISKNISNYEDYNSNLNKDKTNAILLETPENFAKFRNIFEFYITDKIDTIVPYFIIKSNNNDCVIKIKDNIYLLIRYGVNFYDEKLLNSYHPESEIILFNDNKVLKSIGLS